MMTNFGFGPVVFLQFLINSGMVVEIKSTRRSSRQPGVTTDYVSYGYSWWIDEEALYLADLRFLFSFTSWFFESYSIKTRREIFITEFLWSKKEIRKNES